MNFVWPCTLADAQLHGGTRPFFYISSSLFVLIPSFNNTDFLVLSSSSHRSRSDVSTNSTFLHREGIMVCVLVRHFCQTQPSLRRKSIPRRESSHDEVLWELFVKLALSERDEQEEKPVK